MQIKKQIKISKTKFNLNLCNNIFIVRTILDDLSECVATLFKETYF